MFRMLVFGLLFGFVLSRTGATQYDYIEKMFLLQDLHLMGVIGIAILTAGLGLFVIRKYRLRTLLGPAEITPKPRHPGNFMGGLIFGAGWAITGACPGTALSQLGEGKLTAIFTVTGIFVGTLLHRRYGERCMAWFQRMRKSRPQGEAAIAP